MSRRPAWAFRTPMAVTQARWFRTDGTYPVCPQCGISLEREYQRFCDRCGQRLEWKDYERMLSRYPSTYFEVGGK